MSEEPRSVLILAGGTGGHIFPGLAVADEFRSRGVKVRWLGTKGGMECARVPEHGIELEQLEISGVRGKGLMGWLALPFRLAGAVWKARASLARKRPDCVVSFGGYAAGPGGIAAWLRGIPLVVHEQNCVPGLTNKVLAKLARKVLQAFPDTFPDRSGAMTCGNPVRDSVAALAEPDLRFFQRRKRIQLLVTGGSQGARRLNEVVPAALSLLPQDSRPLICHQAGAGNAEDTSAAYESAGIDAAVHEFIDDIASAYEWADLVICRAGALTVSELAAAGLGAILVPYPHAVDDHQTANANYLVRAGAARLMPESDLTPESLAGCLEPLLANRAEMLEMARAARDAGIRDATQKVFMACEPWVKA